MRDLKINGIYKHFKGDYYIVLDVAYYSETKEKLVIYRALYKDNLLNFCEEMGWSSFYIIPSSIHELILIPITEETNKENLKNMIVEVNATQISDEEVLSNNLYIFIKDTNEIRICDQKRNSLETDYFSFYIGGNYDFKNK